MRYLLHPGILATAIALSPVGSANASYAPSGVFVPGAQVVDVAGNPVGTVQSVKGKELILKTDRHEVRLPIKSFTPDKGKLVFGMTREALNQATDAMLAQAMAPGVEVHGKNGDLVGHIDSINEQFVTVKLQSGKSIRLPRDAIAPGANGAVLGITVAELRQMVSQAEAQ